jgi:membrane associated rhomboid family serine protease
MTEEVVEKSKFKKYFDIDIRTTLIYAVLGIIAGYISFIINEAGYAALAMIIILVVAAFATKKLLKIKQDKKWWLGNAVIVYILLWLVVWTIFFNLAIR